jgi:hypothetical protein
MSYMHRFVLVAALAATVTAASAQSPGRFGTGQSHGFRYDTVTIPDVLAVDQAAVAHDVYRRDGGRMLHDGLARDRVRRETPIIPPSKVIIIDNRTGDLWAWSEAEQTVLYLGYIFPLAGQGPFARVINIPEQR